MELNLQNILQSLEGKTVQIEERRYGNSNRISLKILGTYTHQPAGSCGPCMIRGGYVNIAQFMNEDVAWVKFEQGDEPPIIGLVTEEN